MADKKSNKQTGKTNDSRTPSGDQVEPALLPNIQSRDENPDVFQRIQTILSSSGYLQADQDVDFLNRDEVRAIRLQLDFLKAELLLQENRIEHTIVVYGSTRIIEPAVAQQHVQALQNALTQNPDDPDLIKRLAVAKRILGKSQYYTLAREFGRMVGKSGEGPSDCRLVVITGGGPGIMEAANRSYRIWKCRIQDLFNTLNY